MAYIPTVWATGDVITAEKLNNIEDGIVANDEAITDLADGTYYMEGTLTVNNAFNPQSFVLTGGDISELDNYKTATIKVTVSVGGELTAFIVDVPLVVKQLFDPFTQTAVTRIIFERQVMMINAVAEMTFMLFQLAYYESDWVVYAESFKISKPT